MKKIALMLIATSLLWMCNPKPKRFTERTIAEIVADSLFNRYKPKYRSDSYIIRRDTSDIESDTVLSDYVIGWTISPDYVKVDKDTTLTEDLELPYNINIYTNSVLPLNNKKYLIQYLNTKGLGDSKFPLNGIALADFSNSKPVITELKRSEDSNMRWITPKRFTSNNKIIAVVETGFDLGSVNRVCYEMIIEKDSLFATKQLMLADSL